MTNNNNIRTIDFGYVPIRKTFNDGIWIKDIELSSGERAEIRLDYNTNQPFAVLFDGNWNEIKY